MLEKQINAYLLLLYGIIGIVFGSILIFQGRSILEMIILLFGSVIIIIGMTNFFHAFFAKEKKLEIGIKSLINLLFGFIILLFKEYILSSITILFATYIFLIILIDFISYMIYQINDTKRLGTLFHIFINFIFMLILLINPNANIKYVLITVGVYFILYGIQNIINFITEIMPEATADKIKNHIQIPLPILISAILPRHVMTLINKQLETKNPNDFYVDKNCLTPSLEVIIHLAKKGSAAFGHMEIAFEGKTISYGNYNKHSRKLFDSIGDGIILVADRKEYMQYCIENKDRFLVSFGIYLTESQKTQIRNKIKELVTTNTIPYYPDAALVDRKELISDDIHDMSSEIYKLAHGKFYKVTKGKYKTFFVLRNNCSLFAQQILTAAGKNVLNLNGIICPGTYYDYLNSRFVMKNTNVVSRKIYTKNTLKENKNARTTRSRNRKKNFTKTNKK